MPVSRAFSASPSGALVRAGVAALAIATLAATARAQRNPCTQFHPLVDAVDVRGADRVPKSAIAAIPTTERTSVWRRWFGWKVGPLTCLDSADIVSDAADIAFEYQQRGFIAATVTAKVERHGDRRAGVVFEVHEGRPVTITHVTVTGLPHDAADSAGVVRRLVGRPLDDSVVTAVADSLQSLVRDAGRARALPRTIRTTVDSASRAGTVNLGFTPGPLTYIGAISVKVTPSGATPVISEGAVRSAFGVRAGDAFSAHRISDGQRALGALDLYRQVRVDTATAQGATGASRDTIGIALSAVEADRRRAHSTVGWGTLDCFRTQTRYVEQNFLSLGDRLELTGRLSKIGVAAPFDGLTGLCAERVREDPFSQHLNYYLGATVQIRGVAAWQPSVSLFSERRSSIGAYEQTTEIGALVSSIRPVGDRLNLTLQYAFTDSRTTADRYVSCTRFGFCRVEDVASFLARSPEHSVTASLVKNPLLPTDDPQTGYRWSLESRLGHASIGNTASINFARFTAEAASYHPITPWVMLALHAQVGGVIAPGDDAFQLPPSERFYGGGQNSVRGYGENLLGPGSYIVTAIDTITGANGTLYGVARPDVQPSRPAPSGGNASLLGSVELRTRRGWPADLLRWVVFLDVGRVWNTRDVFSVTNADLRATPGVGMRLITPLGPFRMDVGYNPYDPAAGPAFFVQPGDLAAGIAGRAICVSPGSDDPLVLGAGQTSTSNSCPASFVPPRLTTLLSRLTFHFSLGNAF